MTGRPRALTLAGFDPTGGAGILADAIVLARHGLSVSGVVTAWTDQDDRGVRAVVAVGSDLVARWIRDACSSGLPLAAKSGLLPDVATIEGIVETLPVATSLVVDPVLASSDGFPFLDARGVEALLALLVPRARLVTPNLLEAARLTGASARDRDLPLRAAHALLDRGAGAVLVKGGHAAGPEAVDLLVDPSGARSFTAPRVAGPAPRGTGCALSAAIAARLARGESLPDAVERGKALVHAMILAAEPTDGGRPRLGFAAGDVSE